MTTYLERARVARAVKVRVMDEWGIAGRLSRTVATVRGNRRNISGNDIDGASARESSSDPGPRFPGSRLEPAT